MTNEEAKKYMQSKYNFDLLTINGVVLVPLYQIIDRLEQPAPAVPLDRIKAAREEMKECSYSLRRFSDTFDEDERVVDLDNALIILDKMIEEVEGTK